MNPTVTKMDNWMTILKQMKMEALVLEAQKLLIWSGIICINLLRIRWKKSYNSVFFFSFNCYEFFSWRGDLFLVQYVNLNARWKNAAFLPMQ